MKNIIVSLLLIIVIGNGVTPQKATAQTAVSFQVFYDNLSPYGTWVSHVDYGYVWIPSVSSGFFPYQTNGYWTYTDFGWTWVSYYPWGWAPFHYGRWYVDPFYGPMWIPGYEWGPGWVVWRGSGSYYGWAPIGPGISLSVAFGSGYYAPYSHYTFVRCNYMGNPRIYNYYAGSSENTTIINNTTVLYQPRVDKVSNVTYNAGPTRSEVEKHVKKTITPVAVKEISKPGQRVSGNELQIYKPRVQKSTSGAKPAPAKVAKLEDVKPAGKKSTTVPAQKTDGPAKEQPRQLQKAEPSKEAPPQERSIDRMEQKQQPQPGKKSYQPDKQQPSQPKMDREPAKQQPSQPRMQKGPDKPQPSQPQQMRQPSQPQRMNMPPNQPSQPKQPGKTPKPKQ